MITEEEFFSLDPCPRCGSKSIGLELMLDGWRAYCKNCPCRGTFAFTPQNAARTWSKYGALHRLMVELVRGVL